MKTSLNILEKFESINLKEMDRVKLMNRTDIKFTFNLVQLETILFEVLDQYFILEVNGKRISRYKTLYYDTLKHSLYMGHHNGELNRYKIRHRTYVESDIGFLEIKFKSNKGRTIKDRINQYEAPSTWTGNTENFLNNMLPFKAQTLIPAIWVNYSRITFVNKMNPERLTVDIAIEFIKDEETVKLSSLVIAEVKQEKRTQSPFVKVMKKHKIREGSISKYCMGIALTTEKIKKNNFKEKLLNLKNIVNDNSAANCK